MSASDKKGRDVQKVLCPVGFALLISLLVGSCAPLPITSDVPTPATHSGNQPPTPTRTLVPATGTPIPANSTSTPTRTALPPTQTPTASALPISTLAAHLLQTDQVVLTIPNEQPFSGREGDPRPDWLGWGAETFSIAPDGSFWIADTALSPQRLLHFSPQGKLLRKISLEGVVVGLYDLVVLDNVMWVLDIASQPPKVVRLGLDGKRQFSADIPKELMSSNGVLISNGIFNLWSGEGGELLLSGVNGLYEFLDPAGEIVARPIVGLSYQGHTYRTVPNSAAHTLSIAVDGILVDIAPPYYVEEPFLGFASDGSFAIAVHKETPVGGEIYGVEIDWLVHYYALSGELMAVARRWPKYIWAEFGHDLAFGPDGTVYQFVSNPDHSVQIVRLGFTQDLPPLTKATPTPAPTLLTPLRPTWEVIPPNAGDAEKAREALLSFFTHLYDGHYAEAGELYGGSFEELYARESGEDVAKYWERACHLVPCLPIFNISGGNQRAEDEFLFYVEFIWEDGTRFELGPCCGGSVAMTPPVWQFAYPVKKVDGEWKVMRGPLVVP